MGNKRRTLSEWAEIMEQQQGSGMNRRAWCEEKGINYHTFLERAVQIRKQKETPDGQPAQWVEAQEPAGPQSTESMQVEIGPFRVRVPDEFSEPAFIRVCKALVSLC